MSLFKQKIQFHCAYIWKLDLSSSLYHDSSSNNNVLFGSSIFYIILFHKRECSGYYNWLGFVFICLKFCLCVFIRCVWVVTFSGCHRPCDGSASWIINVDRSTPLQPRWNHDFFCVVRLVSCSARSTSARFCRTKPSLWPRRWSADAWTSRVTWITRTPTKPSGRNWRRRLILLLPVCRSPGPILQLF